MINDTTTLSGRLTKSRYKSMPFVKKEHCIDQTSVRLKLTSSKLNPSLTTSCNKSRDSRIFPKWVKTSCFKWRCKIKNPKISTTTLSTNSTRQSETRKSTWPTRPEQRKSKLCKMTQPQYWRRDWPNWLLTTSRKSGLLTIIRGIWKSLMRHSTQSRKPLVSQISKKSKIFSLRDKNKIMVYWPMLMCWIRRSTLLRTQTST